MVLKSEPIKPTGASATPTSETGFSPVSAPAPLAAPASPLDLSPLPFPDTPVPDILKRQLSELETWALANEKDAKRDATRFWVLKIPAILVSASSGVCAYLKWEIVSVIAAAVASLCILIDGFTRGGMLRNVHLRAVHDLRNLQHKLLAKWRIGFLKKEVADELAAEIIECAQIEREKIATYLKDAETTQPVGHDR